MVARRSVDQHQHGGASTMSEFLTGHTEGAVPLTPVTKGEYDAWLRKQPQRVRTWLGATGFKAKPGTRSEEHTSELQSLMRISYAVFCLKKKKNQTYDTQTTSTQSKHKKHHTL